MYILVKKGMLSAYGEIFRKGDVLELEDKVAERLLESEDFEACEEPVVIEPEDDTESADEEEDVGEEKPTKKSTAKKTAAKKTAAKKTSSKRTQRSTVKKDAELPSVDFEAAVKK